MSQTELPSDPGIQVSNYSEKVRRAELRNYFSQFYPVQNVFQERKTDNYPGKAFIFFKDNSAVENILKTVVPFEIDGQKLHIQKILVKDRRKIKQDEPLIDETPEYMKKEYHQPNIVQQKSKSRLNSESTEQILKGLLNPTPEFIERQKKILEQIEQENKIRLDRKQMTQSLISVEQQQAEEREIQSNLRQQELKRDTTQTILLKKEEAEMQEKRQREIEEEKIRQQEMQRLAKEQELIERQKLKEREEQERKRRIAEEVERKELLRIQAEEEQRQRIQKQQEEERRRKEKEQERIRREQEEARKKAEEQELLRKKQEQEKQRLLQLEKQKLKLKDEEEKRSQARNELKTHRNKATMIFPKEAILNDSSNFHGSSFPRWNQDKHAIKVSTDLKKRFTSPVPYPHTIISKERNAEFLRPDEIFNNSVDEIAFVKYDQAISREEAKEIQWNNVKQGVISDCAVISGIIAMIQMEYKRNKLLISDKVYPKIGNSCAYNPNGQYHLCLLINGDWRLVQIDDFIPCYPRQSWQKGDCRPRTIIEARSSINGELWVSLLEKGYLRIHNGFDSALISFCETVFSFCQWLPDPLWELKSIWTQDYEWKKFMRRVKSGNVMISLGISAGKLTEKEEKETGLDQNHAYVLLDVTEVDGTRLLYIRNPHGGEVWRGRLNPWDKYHWTDQLQIATGFNPSETEEQYKQKKDGCFWMLLDDAQRYFDYGSQAFCPDLLPYRQEVHFVWKEEHYKVQKVDVRNRYAPQYIMQKKSKNQKIWFLLCRHFQNEVSPSSAVDQDKKEEKISINISFCKHENPNKFPYIQRNHTRFVDAVCQSTYTNTPFKLFQIGLFDEDIHKTVANERGLLNYQEEIAEIQEFCGEYVGFFTIRVGIYNPPQNVKGDMRFSLFVYSDQKDLDFPLRVKLHHQDEIDVDAHWSSAPMMEFNSGLVERTVSLTQQGIKQTKRLTIRNSVGITAGDRSWQDGKGIKLMQILTKVLDGEIAAKAFFSIARFILGTQIDLVMKPKQGETKYGDQMEILALWENEIEGGIHFDEVDNASLDMKPNIGVGGKSPITLYSDSFIVDGISRRVYDLRKEEVGSKQEVVVKQRAIRVIPFTDFKFYGRRDAFTLQSVGPEGYDVSFIQRKGPWMIMTHEIAWSDIIQAKGGNLSDGPRQKLFYILKTNEATDLHLHFIMLQCTLNNFCPQAEFKVVKLSEQKMLINDEAIATRLNGASDRGEWDKNDEEIFKQQDDISVEQPYSGLFVEANGTKNNGWYLSHSGCGRLNEANAYYGLCVSARRFIDVPLKVLAFGWGNSQMQLFKIR